MYWTNQQTGVLANPDACGAAIVPFTMNRSLPGLITARQEPRPTGVSGRRSATDSTTRQVAFVPGFDVFVSHTDVIDCGKNVTVSLTGVFFSLADAFGRLTNVFVHGKIVVVRLADVFVREKIVVRRAEEYVRRADEHVGEAAVSKSGTHEDDCWTLEVVRGADDYVWELHGHVWNAEEQVIEGEGDVGENYGLVVAVD